MTPRGGGRDGFPDGQAALYELLGDPTLIRLLGCLHDGDARPVTELAACIGADPYAVHEHVASLHRVGLLEASHHGPCARYRAKDIRVFQLLELASEIVSARPASPLEQDDWVPGFLDQLAGGVRSPDSEGRIV